MRNRLLALAFFALWFVVGAFFSLVTLSSFALASLGGNFEPPALYQFARELSRWVLPFLLPLGGVPAAVQIWRSRAWKKLAAASLGICVAIWAFVVVMFYGPELFGWWW